MLYLYASFMTLVTSTSEIYTDLQNAKYQRYIKIYQTKFLTTTITRKFTH